MTATSPQATEGAAWAPSSRRHVPALDGLRAVAVSAVLVQHYVPAVERWCCPGAVGVRFFFTLSGFLITGILLDARGRWRGGGAPGLTMRSFYCRRCLRILPLFVLVLAVTWATGSKPVRATWPWHLGYLSNVYFFRTGTGYDSVTHFWSLAVEEQFYLVWPAVILLVPQRWLVPVVGGVIAVGPLTRAALLAGGYNAWQASILTPACLDTLGLGSLLAILDARGGRPRAWLLRAAWPVGLPLFALACVGVARHGSPTWIVPFDLSIGLLSVRVIDAARADGRLSAAFAWRPLVDLGVISYGVYVIHNFVGSPVTRAFARFGWPVGAAPGRLATMVVATVALAALSWHFFEKPLNALKRYFPYVRPVHDEPRHPAALGADVRHGRPAHA